MEPPQRCVVHKRYVLSAHIGSGSFGTIFRGRDEQTGKDVAAKIEEEGVKDPRLRHEAAVMRSMQGHRGFPELLWFGRHGGHLVLVMNLLGPSLHDLVDHTHGRFSLPTVLQLVCPMLYRLEALHMAGYLHRDLKPDNFVMGMGSSANDLTLIDFGLSTRWRERDGTIVPPCEGRGFVGTMRFVSGNVHRGLRQARRDDVESLAWVLVWLLKGRLPWQGIRRPSESERRAEVARRKNEMSVGEICRGLPGEFEDMVRHARGLAFEEQPDYSGLRRRFRALAKRTGVVMNHVYDWTPKQ